MLLTGGQMLGGAPCSGDSFEHFDDAMVVCPRFCGTSHLQCFCAGPLLLCKCLYNDMCPGKLVMQAAIKNQGRELQQCKAPITAASSS